MLAVKMLAAGMALILLIGAALFFYSPALLVDTVDRMASRADVVKIADGVTFGPENGNRLDIWSTAKKADTPRPVMVFFYGGGWANGTRTEYSYAARPFVERDISSFCPITAKCQRWFFQALFRTARRR